MWDYFTPRIGDDYVCFRKGQAVHFMQDLQMLATCIRGATGKVKEIEDFRNIEYWKGGQPRDPKG